MTSEGLSMTVRALFQQPASRSWGIPKSAGLSEARRHRRDCGPEGVWGCHPAVATVQRSGPGR